MTHAEDELQLTEPERVVRDHYRAFWASRGRNASEVQLDEDGRPPIMNLGLWDPGTETSRGAQRAMVDHLAATVTPLDGLRVLDVGCGLCGPATVLALDYGAEVDGLTIIDEHVEAARRMVTSAGATERVRPHLGSALDLPFADKTFDVVWCLEAAHCFPDRQRFLEEAVRVLRPGGRLTMADLTVSVDVPLVRWQPALQLTMPTLSHWRTLLGEVGLQPVEARSIGRRVYPGLWRSLGRTAADRRAEMSSAIGAAPAQTPARLARAARVWALEFALNRSVLPLGGLLHLRDYVVVVARKPGSARLADG